MPMANTSVNFIKYLFLMVSFCVTSVRCSAGRLGFAPTGAGGEQDLALILSKISVKELTDNAEGLFGLRNISVIEEAVKKTIPHMQLRINPGLS
jgi:hypothetical protein